MNILYEDAALVVLDKPAGLSSEEGVPAALRQLWGQPDAFVGVVHRLDTGVSGLMVCARTPKAAAALKEMGYNVINPAAIDDAIPVECMSYEEIMRIDLELLPTADYLVQLPGWERSIGASRELGFALGTDKIIVSLEQLLTKEVTLS